ncbi:MAG: MT-A70 family methyltransferase [Candidatus Nitrosotenuis sp.]
MKDDYSEILKDLPIDLQREIEENRQRKDYTLLEKAEIQEKLQNIFHKEYRRGRKKESAQNCQNVGTLKSAGITRIDELIGRLTGESKESVRKNRIIYNAVKEAPGKYDDLVRRVDQGKASYKKLFKAVQRTEKPIPDPLPSGQFFGILADPPWRYDLVQAGAAEDHYPTMSTDDICEMGNTLPVGDDAVLFLWATLPKLDDALKVIKSWGFRYTSASVWIKVKNGKIRNDGIGYWTKSAAELLMFATRGAPGTPVMRFPGVITAPRRKHSQKPEIYNLVEQAFQNRNFLELFARHPMPRPNWTFWGNETK